MATISAGASGNWSNPATWTGGTVTYIGEATTGTTTSSSNWRIKRLTQSGSVLIIEWADGNGNFDNIWDNRTSLTYS